MGRTLYISDLHLDGRGPFQTEHPGYVSLEAWHRDFVDDWNKAVISDDDYIWVVGDVCLMMTDAVKEVLESLNGTLALVRGNHDRISQTPEYYDYFEQIHDIAEVIDQGHEVVLCHYPMESWNRKLFGSIHIHGHIHGNLWDAPSVLPNRYNAWSVSLGGVPRSLDWFISREGYDANYYSARYMQVSQSVDKIS